MSDDNELERLNNPRGLKSVLVARFSALGDVAMTVPVLYSACRCYPDVQFTMLTRRSMASIFLNAPANLQVIGVDLEEWKGLSGLSRLFRHLRQQTRFDAFAALNDVFNISAFALLCFFHSIPVAVINKGRKGKHRLTRRNNKVLLPLISTRARYRQVFHQLGLPVESRFDGLFADCPGHRADPATFAAVCPPKPQGERWIGIAPFAKFPGKNYPMELMERVVEELSHKENTRVFLFGGGEQERRVLSRWAQTYPNVTSLADSRLGFGVELGLTSWLDVMVSMDSANMHLASLVGTRVVSVWGATHPYCGFKGWRQREEDMVQIPITCRPCSVDGNKPCYRGDYRCLRAITPAQILQRINS